MIAVYHRELNPDLLQATKMQTRDYNEINHTNDNCPRINVGRKHGRIKRQTAHASNACIETEK